MIIILNGSSEWEKLQLPGHFWENLPEQSCSTGIISLLFIRLTCMMKSGLNICIKPWLTLFNIINKAIMMIL